MYPLFEWTVPDRSRWPQSDTNRVAFDIDWVARCRRRLLESSPRLLPQEALELANELGLDDYLRAQSPEGVAEELVRSDVDPFARLEGDFT